jgi:hypothetical protein
MSDSGPWFYAWCDVASRVDAFAAALSALVAPRWTFGIMLQPLGRSTSYGSAASVDEVLAALRPVFGTGVAADTSFGVRLSSGRVIDFAVTCVDHDFELRCISEPICGRATDTRDLIIQQHVEIAVAQGARSVVVEAAVRAMQVQADIDDMLTRFCGADRHTGVTTGACSQGGWNAPVELCATYHADINLARDLALSWIHLHEGERMARAAGLPLNTLRARVEGAPPGARINVATDLDQAQSYFLRDRAAAREARHSPLESERRVKRAAVPGAAELSREQILAVLTTPPDQLLEALEAAAVPDDEWRATEPTALAALEATKEGAPAYEIDVSTGRHMRWIERHAPFHVRRLPNGGVMLATHPYRILWPLWADALHLLDIR